MATTQEIEQAGIHRELKMIAVDHAAKIIAKLGMAASADEDLELLQLCHAFCVGSNGLLEAMLAVGGEEIITTDQEGGK